MVTDIEFVKHSVKFDDLNAMSFFDPLKLNFVELTGSGSPFDPTCSFRINFQNRSFYENGKGSMLDNRIRTSLKTIIASPEFSSTVLVDQ